MMRHTGNTPHQTPRFVKDQYGLVPVSAIIAIEQAHLLAAMNFIKGLVDIQHHRCGRTLEGFAINPDQLMLHPDKTARVGHVLHA